MKAAAIDFDAVLGDTRPLWQAWLTDASRRLRTPLDLPADRGAAASLLTQALGTWEPLLKRFAEDHGPLYLRPRADVNAALRRLRQAGVTVGAYTDAPEPLARVAALQLGVARLLDLVETGAGARERLLERLGREAVVVDAVCQLVSAGTYNRERGAEGGR
ncbi:MAG: hypothetical protein C4307_03990 [Chloroflexota bacterium]